MNQRFLAYSLRHQKTIKAILMDEEGQIRNLNIQVTQLLENGFNYTQRKRNRNYSPPMSASFPAATRGVTRAKLTCTEKNE